ncbi:MAG: CRTAC1 family protein, partial [Planctomycetota bacterium]
DGRFTDVTEEAGTGNERYGKGVATGDIDNDGDVDLYVANYGLDCLYRNDGDGSFTEITDAAGITNEAWSVSAGFGDYDADGFLDLYVTNYVLIDPSVRPTDSAGRPEYPAPGVFDGVDDVLYRNNGDGTFTDVTVAAGIAGKPAPGMGVVFTDLDADGRIDIYVANDGQRNFAWIQEPGGRFTDRALEMGLAIGGHGRPEASMGIALGDYDGDGDGDLFLTHFALETNTLYRQFSPGQFEDATTGSGLGAPGVDFTSFGTAFLDVELDGDLDLVVVNGRVLRRLPHAGSRVNAHWRPYAEPNQLYLNDGSGHFALVGERCGALCDDIEVSRGVAAGDLDRDGDIDLVVTNGNGTVRLYRNDSPRAGSWLVVRAVDPALRRDALGAVVEVAAGSRRWRRPIRTAHSYLSASEPTAHFGLGETDAVDEITVRWPDGTLEVFPGGPAERRVVLERGAGRTIGAAPAEEG